MRVSVEEWCEWVLAGVGRTGTEYLPIARSYGRTLAAEVTARHDMPLWDNTAMDGYALRSTDTQGATAENPVPLTVTGEVLAGSSDDPPLGHGQAVRIMTGAPVPSDADAVVPVELTLGGGSAGSTGDAGSTGSTGGTGDAGSTGSKHEIGPAAWQRGEIRLTSPVKPGANIRRQGEDVSKGSPIALPGEQVTAARISALAAAGVTVIEVGVKPRIGVLVTGSELRGGDAALARGQIVESNSLLVSGLVRECGLGEPRVLRSGDTTDAVNHALKDLGRDCDVIITTGGIGPGSHDVVRIAVEREPGVRTTHLPIRPGAPQCAGRLASGPWLFGLPGNPVSAAVSFELFVRPALLAMQGRAAPHRLRVPGVAAVGWRGKLDRLQIMPVTLDAPAADTEGALPCRPAVNPSGVSGAVGGHGAVQAYALVGPDRGDVEAGEPVELLLVEP